MLDACYPESDDKEINVYLEAGDKDVILPTTSDKTSSSTDMRHPQNIQTSYSKLKPEHGLSFCSLVGSQKEAWAVEAAWSRLPEHLTGRAYGGGAGMHMFAFQYTS
ncbi:hypothetical protein An04g06820 [Aspergillus niger]|uniref:Uncharacterized protein n=2 Tax=Aspergillus niger TaxID=5061 RepID=A2QJE7_ASPNC|nr:hypothetical protein An04g06820 [Aspergillus niger]CAK44682.1 hypothetical protein An04g06820 [Aspergillus niger]